MSLSYVVTGACYDSASDIFSNCAFEATECETGTTFQSSRQVQARGHVPCDVRDMPAGRCTSSIDQIGCTNTNDACSIGTKFERQSTGCNMAQNTIDGETTTFGACSPNPTNSDETDGYHCAWSKADCTAGKDSWVNGGLTSWMGGCDCSKVKTGACRTASGEHHCAVSEQACDADTTFIPMRALSIEDGHPDISCRLCPPAVSAEAPPMVQAFVTPGGCYIGNVRQACAMQASECAAGQVFRSSLEISSLGQPLCDTDAVTVGRCTSTIDRADCTNRADACEINTKFQAKDATCTIKNDSTSDEVTTLFGSCLKSGVQKSYLCSWSSDSCENGAVGHWLPAVYNNYWKQGCSCDLVHTGACKTASGDYYCAVAEDSCDADSEFLLPRQLLSSHNMDCRLCVGEKNSIYSIGANLLIPQPPTPPPVVAPTPAPAPLSCPSVPSNGCSVCGPGKCITNPDEIFSFAGQPSLACSALEQAGNSGLVPLDNCPTLPAFINTLCGCQEATAPTMPPTNQATLPPTPVPAPLTCPIVPNGGCSVCGTGKCITKPDVVFAFPGQPRVPCGLLENAGNAGVVPLVGCQALPSLIKDDCGCQDATSYAASPTFAPQSPTRAPQAPQPVFVAPTPIPRTFSPQQLAFGSTSKSTNMAPGAIAGIAIGSIVGAFILGLVIYMVAKTSASPKRDVPTQPKRDAATAGVPINADGSTSMRNVQKIGEETA